MHSPSPAIQLYNIIILKLISSPQLTTTFLITHITHSQYLRIKYVLIMKNLQLDCKNISILVLFLEHPSRLHPGIWSDFRKFVSFPGLAVSSGRVEAEFVFWCQGEICHGSFSQSCCRAKINIKDFSALSPPVSTLQTCRGEWGVWRLLCSAGPVCATLGPFHRPTLTNTGALWTRR